MAKKGLKLHITMAHPKTKAPQIQANNEALTDVNISINKEVSKMKEVEMPFETQRYIDQQFAAKEKEREEQIEKKELKKTLQAVTEKVTEIANQQKSFCELFPQMCTVDEVKTLSKKVDNLLDTTANTNQSFCEMYPELCKRTETNAQNIASLQTEISTLKDMLTSSITPINEQIGKLKTQTDDLCALNPALCQQVEEIKSIIKTPECPTCKERQQRIEHAKAIKAERESVLDKIKEKTQDKDNQQIDIDKRLAEIRMLREQRLLRKQQSDNATQEQQAQEQKDTADNKSSQPETQAKKRTGIFG